MHIEGQWVIEKPVDSSHLLKLNNASRLIFFWLQGFALLLLCALQKIQMDQSFLYIFYSLNSAKSHAITLYWSQLALWSLSVCLIPIVLQNDRHALANKTGPDSNLHFSVMPLMCAVLQRVETKSLNVCVCVWERESVCVSMWEREREFTAIPIVVQQYFWGWYQIAMGMMG